MYVAPSGERESSYKTPDLKISFDSASVAKIEIHGPGGKSVTVENTGGQWMVTSPVRYKANTSNVTEFLSGLAKFKVGSLVSSNPAKANLFSVDSSEGTKLSVTDRSNKTTTLVIGKSGPAYTDFYFRTETGKEVYLGEGPQSYMLNREVKEWRDKSIFTGIQDSIRTFTVEYGDKEYKLFKPGMNWTMNGDSIANTDVTPILSSLCALNASDFVDTLPKFDSKPITFKVQSGIGGTVTELNFYPMPPDSARYFVQTSNTTQVFTILKWTVTQLTRPFAPKETPKAVTKGKKGKK
jgi:hypothetical protein